MPALEHFDGGRDVTAPATRHFAITPSDSTDLTYIPRAIRCDVAGTAALRDEHGTEITYNLAAGEVLDFRVVRVLSTGTTATLIGWS